MPSGAIPKPCQQQEIYRTASAQHKRILPQRDSAQNPLGKHAKNRRATDLIQPVLATWSAALRSLAVRCQRPLHLLRQVTGVADLLAPDELAQGVGGLVRVHRQQRQLPLLHRRETP